MRKKLPRMEKLLKQAIRLRLLGPVDQGLSSRI